jgi:hypothetical protein
VLDLDLFGADQSERTVGIELTGDEKHHRANSDDAEHSEAAKHRRLVRPADQRLLAAAADHNGGRIVGEGPDRIDPP